MGAGIAQLGLQAGVETRLLDTDPAALGLDHVIALIPVAARPMISFWIWDVPS